MSHRADRGFTTQHRSGGPTYHARNPESVAKQPIEIRPCNRMTDEGRPDVWPGVEDRADGPERVQPRALPGPLQCSREPAFNICLDSCRSAADSRALCPPRSPRLSFREKMLKFRCSEKAKPTPGESSELRPVARQTSDPSPMTTRPHRTASPSLIPRGTRCVLFYSTTFRCSRLGTARD